jgi:hypothetical protein
MKVDHNRRLRARDAAIRRTRMIIAAVAASAVALSGLFAGVAAQAFKGHQPGAATAPQSGDAAAPAQPASDEDTGPLQPPSQPPSAASPQDSVPQVSGGS